SQNEAAKKLWKRLPNRNQRSIDFRTRARFLKKHGGHIVPQARVLSVGLDVRILDTRELILRSAGYSVVSAISIKEAVFLFKDGGFDVIVLCHTLSAKDCERLTGAVRASGS